MTKGDIIELDKVVVVTVVWCNETLMQVEYKDLTRRLLKIADYEIKILSEETRKDFSKLFCPKCKSDNIHQNFNTDTFVCNNCSYLWA